MNSSRIIEIFYIFFYVLYLSIYSIIAFILKQIIPYKYRSKDIKGETVLITGSGNGIGKSMAKKFAKLGSKVLLVDIDEKSNKQTEEEILNDGGIATSFTCDLSNREDIFKLTNEIKKNIGQVNILINNAGIYNGRKLTDLTDSMIEKTFQVNVMSHFWLTKAFLPSMLDQNHGHIVTISSMAGILATGGLCDYSSSKYASLGFNESLKNELMKLGKDGIKTTVVCPFFIKTNMTDGLVSDLIRLLDADYVADKVVEAVLTDQSILLMPKLMYLLYVSKGFLNDKLAYVLGLLAMGSAHPINTLKK